MLRQLDSPSSGSDLDEALLHQEQLEVSWHQIAAWHGLAALLDWLCLPCVIVLIMGKKCRILRRPLRLPGRVEYFAWGARGRELIEPQLLLLRQVF